MSDGKKKVQKSDSDKKPAISKLNRYQSGRLFRFVTKIPCDTSTKDFLRPSDKYVLLVIGGYLALDMEEPFSEKTAWPSYEIIARDTGFDKRTVINAVGRLVANGFVSKEATKNSRGGDGTNTYSIHHSLPAFYEYFEANALLSDPKLNKAEIPAIISRLVAASEEIKLALAPPQDEGEREGEKDTRTDAQKERDLVLYWRANMPGLYELRIKPWLVCEKARQECAELSTAGVNEIHSGGERDSLRGERDSLPGVNEIHSGGERGSLKDSDLRFRSEEAKEYPSMNEWGEQPASLVDDDGDPLVKLCREIEYNLYPEKCWIPYRQSKSYVEGLIHMNGLAQVKMWAKWLPRLKLYRNRLGRSSDAWLQRFNWAWAAFQDDIERTRQEQQYAN